MKSTKKKYWNGREEGKEYISPEVWIAQKMMGRAPETHREIAEKMILQTLIDNPDFSAINLIQNCQHTGSSRKRYSEKFQIIREAAKKFLIHSEESGGNSKRTRDDTTKMLVHCS